MDEEGVFMRVTWTNTNKFTAHSFQTFCFLSHGNFYVLDL